MSAFVKVYTDSGHTSEVAHTTNHATTIASGHAATAGDTALTLTDVTNMPTAGTIDIIDGSTGNETIAYYGLAGAVVQLAAALAHNHATGVTANQWYYSLAVGDQTNGIPNDGTNAAPNSPTNVATWYAYNAGDQIAQTVTLATVSGAPSTTAGFADTAISQTSQSASFAASQNLGNMAVAAVKQFWVAAEIPSGQSAAGNPQVCQITLSYSSI